MLGLIWCHSGYSFHQGSARVEDLLEFAAGLGWKTMALTDVNGLYGAVWFRELAQAAGIKAIIGAEVRDEAGEQAALLVKNAQGYRRLCSLLTKRHLDKSFSLRKELCDPASGLVALTDQEPLAGYLSEITGTDLYVFAPPHRLHRMTAFAAKRGLKPVAANPVYYLKKEDRFLHHLLRAVKLRTSFSKVNGSELIPDPAWLPSEEEFKSWYNSFPDALRNLEEVIEKCADVEPLWGEVVLFDFEQMAGENSFELLSRKVWEGAKKRYGAIIPEVKGRIEKELELIRRKGFASYFLIIEDIVRKFPITCGRGSAAASIASYCLFITHVDPVRHRLLFERFLSPGRKDPPDIDVDFPWDERDDVLDYVFARYGPERTAMVTNHLSFQSRAAIREVARVFGIPEPEISRVTKRMHGYLDLLAPMDEMKSDPFFRGINFEPPWDRIIDTALRLEGLPCGVGVHCGGVVIADRIKERVPLETAPKGVNIIQWEKDQTEDAGLVKLDLLGNRSLAVIRDAIKDVNRCKGAEISLDYASLDPLDDPLTQKIIAEGQTMGVFYIESPATRQLQQKAQVGDFEHIVIHSSIIRPAAHKLINEYVKRLHGEKWAPIHPKLDEVLSETFGIMVYQEDVMKVAVEMAGFSFEEASELRKALSKKHRHKKLKEFEEKFGAGASEQGILESQSAKIWEMVLSFQGYSFCKPHSASYAMVSFKSAWLRAHHPAEFMAAVISNQGGCYSTFAYISEAKRMGLEVRLPEINSSEIRYTPEGRALRVGLMQIKGLETKTAEKIIEERRRGGKFDGLLDFLYRLDPDLEQARLLVKAGCFDNVGINEMKTRVPEEPGRFHRAELFWVINAWSSSKTRGQMGLFRPNLKIPKGIRRLSEGMILRQEMESFGFLISRHPLSFYRDRIKRMPITPACEFKNKVGARVMAVGWYISGKHAVTNKDELMEFVSFEDETDIYETVFFPSAYRRYCHLLHRDGAFVLTGTITADLDAVSLQVENMKPLAGKNFSNTYREPTATCCG